jgi:hypothetical protein
MIIMKHQIDYKVEIGSLVYTMLTEDYLQATVDFYFDVFLKGK